ncbi:type I-E CRISPR-associated endoribonuclease Cas2e [Janibacter sp. GXQ6167]|uniref:type I-E CRISPR-associated endoribonuclease Cas2e n=1 Tax=Janibacter sp. GXQ6167 TaxID=3240791 RepID=UPI003523DC70
MVVLVLTAVPPGLRGHLTRWLLEIAPGVFVGRLGRRVRDELWDRVLEHSGEGRALMVYNAIGEQGLTFVTHNHDWTPVDLDGVQLMRRREEQYEEAPVRPSRGAPRTAMDSAEVRRRRQRRKKFS